jgi:hypothetical protein
MTSDPDKQINDNWTVGELEAEFEGQEYVTHHQVRKEDHFFCDFCSRGIAYQSNPRVAWYVADGVLNPGHPVWRQAVKERFGGKPIVPLAVYCPGCSTRRVLFPCEGYAEVHAFFDLDEGRVLKNVEVTDVSPPDDGIPWEPRELSERITEIPWDQHMLMQTISAEDQLWGPENMITFFLSAVDGVDPRELIQYDGSLDPKLLGQARKSWKQFRKKMKRGGHSRKKFRDHVRGDEKP